VQNFFALMAGVADVTPLYPLPRCIIDADAVPIASGGLLAASCCSPVGKPLLRGARSPFFNQSAAPNRSRVTITPGSSRGCNSGVLVAFSPGAKGIGKQVWEVAKLGLRSFGTLIVVVSL
jgi:hypothetical protein